MTTKLSFSLPHGAFSFVRNISKNSLLFENEATGESFVLSKTEIPGLLVTTDYWPAWGRPANLITEDGSGWDH
jgi:hypothetical protein